MSRPEEVWVLTWSDGYHGDTIYGIYNSLSAALKSEELSGFDTEGFTEDDDLYFCECAGYPDGYTIHCQEVEGE